MASRAPGIRAAEAVVMITRLVRRVFRLREPPEVDALVAALRQAAEQEAARAAALRIGMPPWLVDPGDSPAEVLLRARRWREEREGERDAD